MYKLQIPPEQDGYDTEESAEAVSRVQLDGGAGRYRRVLFGTSTLINCTWILGPDEYDYLMMFYRETASGSLPFLADLIIEGSDLTECECRFMPKTFKLASVNGLAHTVVATIEATPVNSNVAFTDANIKYLLLYFGPRYADLFKLTSDRLDKCVNIDYPNVFSISTPPVTELDLYLQRKLGEGYVYKMRVLDEKLDNTVNVLYGNLFNGDPSSDQLLP